MPSPLENLSGPGRPLAAEPADAEEFAGLKRSGLIRLRDADNAANSLESRFDLAYNAAHALSLAALRWHGYRDLITACKAVAARVDALAMPQRHGGS